MKKLPFIPIYPGDWLRDSVSGCSLAAQALWFRMMMVMHDSDRPGYLSINGSPIPPGSIAQRCGCTPELYDTLFRELQEAGVPSITQSGVIYSRRMVRDQKLREKWSKSGKKGGGNPKLKNTNISINTGNEDENIPLKVVQKAGLYSSSSSSSKDLKSVCVGAPATPPYHSDDGQHIHADAIAILHELNERCQKHYPDTIAGLAVIKARLAEGRLREEFSRIIDVKLRDPHFIRNPNLYDPSTLFAVDKFDRYLHQDPDGWDKPKGMEPTKAKAKDAPKKSYVCEKCGQDTWSCNEGGAIKCPDCGGDMKEKT